MANKLLDRCIKEMREGITDSVVMENEAAKSEAEDKLQRYKECAERNGTFEVTFSYANTEGDLIAQDAKGVKVEFLAKDIKEDIPYYSPYYKDRFLNTPLVVRIVAIDDKTEVIRVRSGRSTGFTTKKRLIRAIEKEMEALKQSQIENAGEDGKQAEPHYFELLGRVESVEPKRAVVNILGKGIIGFCYARNWQKNYTRDMTDFCKKGQVYEFQVIGKLPSKRGRETGFNLSHVPYTRDAWEDIPKELFEENAVILVECLERPLGKNYWWGKTELIPGIEVIGDYNSNIGTIRETITYKCKIRKIDTENHLFRVIPFAVAEKDRDKVDSIRFIEVKRKNRA
ncbi:MAG: hypothetical protein K6E34_02385 [Lachnospiraceae bacterium]|nr:hypothetical protein [Lachnospiraceae bacterium]